MNGAITAELSPGATPAANLAVLQRALDTGRSVHIPRGLHPLAPGASAMAAGQVVFGDGQHQSILDCRGSGDFLADGEFWGFEVRDLQLCGKVDGQQVTGGYGIVFDGSVRSNRAGWQTVNTRIQRVLMDGMWRGVHVRDQNNMIIDGLQMAEMQDHGIVAESPDANARTDAVTLRDIVFSPAAAAVEAGRGTGLLVDGNVQTIAIQNMNIVGALRGIDVQNTANRPFGEHAAFLFADMLSVDYPLLEAVRITHVDRARFSNGYFHGSKQADGFWLGAGAREIVLSACNVTSHWKSAIRHGGLELDLLACDLDDACLGPEGTASGLTVASASRVSVTGGSIAGPRAAYGIERLDPKAPITVTGTRLLGARGAKNF